MEKMILIPYDEYLEKDKVFNSTDDMIAKLRNIAKSGYVHDHRLAGEILVVEIDKEQLEIIIKEVLNIAPGNEVRIVGGRL